MPSIIKANARLSAGGVQLTTYAITAQSDNSLGINADFVCLSRFDSVLAASFRVGADLPYALASEPGFVALLNGLKVSTTPRVQGVNITRANGLTTFSLSLGVESDPATDSTALQEITTNTELKSLSGSVVFTALNNQSASLAFDYYATSVTKEGSSPIPVEPSAPFNLRGDIKDIGNYIGKQNIISHRTVRNNVGQYKTTTTISRVYVQRVFRI